MLAEVDEFLAGMLPRQLTAEHALCRGDASLRWETWSQRDPVTLFGASVPLRSGWDELADAFRSLATHFSGLLDYEFELLAAGASGDIAYTVAFEHKTVLTGAETVTYTLRVTHVYRREEGTWKVVHRHGDRLRPVEQEAS